MKKNIQQVYAADCRWAAQLGCHREQRGRYELAFYRTFVKMFRCFLSLKLTLRSTSPSTSFDLFSLSNDKRRVEGRRCPSRRKQHLPLGRRRRHVGFSFSFFPLVRTAEKEFPFFSSTLSLCSFSTCGGGALLESCSSRLLLLLLGRSWFRGLASPLIPKSSKKTNEPTRINTFWIVSKLTRGEPKLACRINRKKNRWAAQPIGAVALGASYLASSANGENLLLVGSGTGGANGNVFTSTNGGASVGFHCSMLYKRKKLNGPGLPKSGLSFAERMASPVSSIPLTVLASLRTDNERRSYHALTSPSLSPSPSPCTGKKQNIKQWDDRSAVVAPLEAFTAAASSDDGQRLAVCSNPGSIYTSVDGASPLEK